MSPRKIRKKGKRLDELGEIIERLSFLKFSLIVSIYISNEIWSDTLRQLSNRHRECLVLV